MCKGRVDGWQCICIQVGSGYGLGIRLVRVSVGLVCVDGGCTNGCIDGVYKFLIVVWVIGEWRM